MAFVCAENIFFLNNYNCFLGLDNFRYYNISEIDKDHFNYLWTRLKHEVSIERENAYVTKNFFLLRTKIMIVI